MISQLRIFTINRGKMDDFLKAWSDGVYPLRQNHGFNIPAAWVSRERNEFMWILTYDGPDDWETKDAAYYASEERTVLEPDPRQYIARGERRFIDPVQLGK